MNGEIVKNNSNINHSAQPSDWGGYNFMYFYSMMFFKPLVLFFILLCCQCAYTQQLFESGIVYGGVTGGGFSTNTGSGTVVSNVAIPPNSTIKKAYLLATRDGIAPDIDVVLNGNIYTFTNASVISNKFISTINTWTWANSTIHAMDITNNIDSSVTVYSLTIPPQFNITINGFYSSFYLFIVYENPALSKLAYNLFINEQDVAITSTYSLVNFSPINNNNSVGLEMWSTFFCDTIQDGSYIDVNSNQIGLLGGSESNTIHSCTGVYSNFAHYNDSLFGLEDDTPDSLMSATDALADIKSYVNNNDTNVNVVFTLQTPGIQGGKLTNPIVALMLSYSTPCDTFTTTATAIQDTICLGNSVQLNATGGSTYSWFGAFGGLSDTSIANPIASPPQTTTYIVTIKNDSGCVKTEHVKIWVTQPIDSITTTPTICGSATGSITAHFNTNTNYNFTLYDSNFNLLTNNTTGFFNQLTEGVYIVENTLHNCTFYDTVTVNSVNNVMANFYSFPQAPWNNPNQPLGKAPMEVSFFNASQNANGYQWSITQQPNNDTIVEIPVCTGMTSSCGLQHFFTEGGTYQVCLIAYNNQPQCADTVCKTIFIDNNEEISLFIPNVFTPNGDNENDNFTIQVIGAEYLESLEVEVFNRWGQQISNYKLEIGNSITNLESPISNLTVWNGTTTAGVAVPEGTYFYVITYKTKAGETVTEKGTVSLLR